MTTTAGGRLVFPLEHHTMTDVPVDQGSEPGYGESLVSDLVNLDNNRPYDRQESGLTAPKKRSTFLCCQPQI